MRIWLHQITLCLLLFAAVAASQEPITCTDTNQYVYNDCQCLEFVIDPQVYWDVAERRCIANGGHLVTIKDMEKQDYIADILNRISERRGVWIGMKRDDSKVLRWVDGSAVADGFQYWADTEPNPSYMQLCGMIHLGDQWKWKDYFCGIEEYSYICEYELNCNPEEGGSEWDTNIVIGIVVGSVVGLICFFALVFFLINCCRDAVRMKRRKTPNVQLREVETGCNYEEEVHTSDPMIPPPEKTAITYPINDLDRASVKKRRTPLMTANVVVSASADCPPAASQLVTRDSIKISNLPQAEGSAPDQEDLKRRNSLEDNYLAANTDTDDPKSFTCSKEKL